MSVTLILIIAISLVSVIGFNNQSVFMKLQLNPYQVYHRKQWYRLVSHAFLHADWIHLLINMLVLYSFGQGIEYIFRYYNNIFIAPQLFFLILFFSAVIIASLGTLRKYKDEPFYNSVGASGGVSAMIFAFIFFEPWQKLYLFAIIPIPGIIFAFLYLAYSNYMSRKGSDNINHDAHFIGAVFGFLFPVILKPGLIKVFIDKLTNLPI